MAARARISSAAGALDETLASLAEGVRVVSVLLHPYMPASVERLLRRARLARGRATPGAVVRTRGSGRAGRSALEPLFPKRRDRLPHAPGRCASRPTPSSSPRRSTAGVSRIVTVGTDGASCRAALAAAEDFPQVYAAIGRHPNAATGFDDADLAELEALAAHPRCVGDRRDRPRLLPRLRPARRTRSVRSRRRSSWRGELGKPLVIHTRAADDDTLSMLVRARRAG